MEFNGFLVLFILMGGILGGYGICVSLYRLTNCLCYFFKGIWGWRSWYRSVSQAPYFRLSMVSSLCGSALALTIPIMLRAIYRAVPRLTHFLDFVACVIHPIRTLSTWALSLACSPIITEVIEASKTNCLLSKLSFWVNHFTSLVWLTSALILATLFVITRFQTGIAKKTRQALLWISQSLQCYYDYYAFCGVVKPAMLVILAFACYATSGLYIMHMQSDPNLTSNAMLIFDNMLWSILGSVTLLGTYLLLGWIGFVIRSCLLNVLWQFIRKTLWGSENRPATRVAFAQVFFFLGFGCTWLCSPGLSEVEHRWMKDALNYLPAARQTDLLSLNVLAGIVCGTLFCELSFGYLLRRLWQKEVYHYPTVRLARSISSLKSLIQWLQSGETYVLLSTMRCMRPTVEDKKSAWQQFSEERNRGTLRAFQKEFSVEITNILEPKYSHIPEWEKIRSFLTDTSEKPILLSESDGISNGMLVRRRDRMAHHLIQLLNGLRCDEVVSRLCTFHSSGHHFIQTMEEALEQILHARNMELSAYETALKSRGYEIRKSGQQDQVLEKFADPIACDFGFLTFRAFFDCMIPIAFLNTILKHFF